MLCMRPIVPGNIEGKCLIVASHGRFACRQDMPPKLC